MTTTEPGWVAENELADSLGWEREPDGSRGTGDSLWSRFSKSDDHVWKVRSRIGVEWVRARLTEGRFCLHESYLTLERALKGER